MRLLAHFVPAIFLDLGVLAHFPPWLIFRLGVLSRFGSKNQTRAIVKNYKDFEL